MKHKLSIVVSHPIQYYSPLFVELAKVVEMKVFYAFQPNAEQQGAVGFGKAFEWDVDLLNGYSYEFLDNRAKVPSSAYFAGCDTPAIGQRLNSYGATHVVTFGWHLKMHRQALAYCKKNKLPIAVRGDSQLNPQLPLWKKVVKRVYYPTFLRKYDAFLAVGNRNKAYLMKYGVHEKRILFSPHAIDQDFWRVEKRVKKAPFIFIWVAKFTPKKRPLDVIRAFKQLIEEQPRLKERVMLKMLGSGDLLEQAKNEAKGINQIEFLGFKNQTELKEAYASADCLILSSDYGETWGLVVNEAFAAGIPAIVSDACGCSADLIIEKSGLSYEMGNIKALKRVMLNQINLSASQLQQITNQIKLINKTYSYDAIIRSFKQFLVDEKK